MGLVMLAKIMNQLGISYRGKTRDGFTVVEVMVVVGITGVLFVLAALAISGRQGQTGFDQAIRQVQSQVQQVINEVATGYFPNSTSFECTAGAFGPSLSAGSTGQGANTGCIFLGKALQFRVAGTTPESFATLTITGLQLGGSEGAESSSLAEAKPIVVAPSTTHGGYPSLNINTPLQNGLTTSRMWYNNGSTDTDIGAVAFVNSLASFSDGDIVSGSSSVDMVALNSTALGAASTVIAEAINNDGGNALANGAVNPSGGVFICFASGGTRQYGIIQIGGVGRELAVNLRIKNNTGSPCTNS